MENKKLFVSVQPYTESLNKKSKLKALLEAWKGKKFEVEELHRFQLENMLGEPCYLTIDHVVNEDGQKYIAKVFDISPLPIDSNPCLDLHTMCLSVLICITTRGNLRRVSARPSFTVAVYRLRWRFRSLSVLSIRA